MRWAAEGGKGREGAGREKEIPGKKSGRGIFQDSGIFSDAKDFFRIGKNKFYLMLAVVFIGIALRAYFFNSTDITWDEAFHIMLGYKIGAILSLYPIVAVAFAAILAAFVYFSAIKPNQKIQFLFLVAGIVAVYFFSVSPVLHPRHPPLFSLAVAPLTMLGTTPLMAAYIINTISALLMAFSAFFLARTFFSEKAAIFAFAFVMLSPYNIFYSASAYITPLADSLMFTGLALFFIAFEKNRSLVPLAALLLAGAFFTRYTTLMALPVLGIYLILKRNEVAFYENRNNYAPALLILATTMLVLFPAILSSFSGFANWTTATTADLYLRDIPHYSAYLMDFFGENPIKPQQLFFVKEMLAFYSVGFVAIFLVGAYFALRKKNALLVSLLAMFAAYFIFYSMQKNFQDMNYLLELEFIMLFVTAVFLSELKIGAGAMTMGNIFAAGLCAVFLLSSVFLITSHNFTGLSETVAKIPEGKTIFTDFIDPVKYYRGEYVKDRTLNNRAFAIITQIFGQQAEPAHSTIVFSNDPIDSLPEKPDYAILTQLYFDEGKTSKEMEKCGEIKEGNIVVFYVFAENKGLCDAMQ